MNNDEPWVVYHKNNTSSPETDHLHLDVNDATADDNTMFNDTLPDTVNFTLGSNDQVNKNGEDVMAYMWTSIKGYSKFGGYTGNNKADGPFVYLGFRPAWLLIKDAGSGQSWHMFDSKRELFNDNDAAHLIPSEDDSEAEAKVIEELQHLIFYLTDLKLIQMDLYLMVQVRLYTWLLQKVHL